MRKVSIVLTALMLGGCQTLGVSGSEEPSFEPIVSTPPTAAAPAVAAPAPASNSSLIGMTADTLKSLWGEPALARKEAGAEMYGGSGNCSLLVYLYTNTASNVMTVTHAEAVPGGSDEAAIATCAKAAGKPPLKPIS
jgi:hypothetical protein